VTDLLERLRSALSDRYAIESEIGRGGMATVYLAEDLKHHRKVAIKVLHPELAAAIGADRFLQEIEIVAGLQHPHILPLHDSGEADGLLYYVMPYVEGESLRERLERERQLPVDEAVRITRDAAEALDHAHRHGLIHRDIKPGNILLEEGHAVVTDFGVARTLELGEERITATGMGVGTPAYMSPEQAAGEEIDTRSDVYALGCVLYELLSGEPPHTGPTSQAIIAKKMSEPAPRVSVVRETVPPTVDDALNRALARNPVDRFPTAAEFSSALVADAGHVTSGSRGLRAIVVAAALIACGAGIWAVASSRISTAGPDEPAPVALDSTAIAVLPFQVIGADSASDARLLAHSVGILFELQVTGEFGRRIAHPGSVLERWRDAGGTLDSALSEADELQLGRDLGVGALVRGTVVQHGENLVLAASMVDVITGEPRVRTVRAEGPIDERFELVDQLIVQLLSRDGGLAAADAARLSHRHSPPEAIQAYLAANRAPSMSLEQKRLYRAALEADSGLVDAAVELYAAGESPADSAELRFAWEHQDQLAERSRAYLKLLAAGRLGSIRTMTQKINGYAALARRWPEWSTAWAELGGDLTIWGALAGEPDWRRRARESLLRPANPPSEYRLWNLVELAFIDEDTVLARELSDAFAARATGAGWLQARAPAYQWRAALLEGDTAAARRALAETPDSLWVPFFASADGRGLAYADQVVAAGPEWLNTVWAWTRGRKHEWQDAAVSFLSGPESAAEVVFKTLLLGPSEDTLALEALDQLERLASGRAGQQDSPDERIRARCWSMLWRLEHGDTTGVRETLSELREVEERTKRFAGWRSLLEVLLTRLDGGDVHAALLRSDSVVRELPLPTGLNEFIPWPAEAQNLMLARLLGEYGEPKRALDAIRRRPYHSVFLAYYGSLPDYLREEARLAAAVDDTAAAVAAYRHYFALRDVRPDYPRWAAQWDSMRVEYALLTGIEASR